MVGFPKGCENSDEGSIYIIGFLCINYNIGLLSCDEGSTPYTGFVFQADKQLSALKQYFSTSEHNKNVARLSYAASIVEEMRAAIYQQTSFRCSAGISHNKVLKNIVQQ